MSKDYYSVLGVSKSASAEEIKKSFRKLAHQHHPDKKGGDEAKFKEINEAYQVLSNEEKRKQYDQFGTTFDNASRGGGYSQGGFDFGNFGGFNNANVGFDFGDMGDIFSDFFGGSRRGGKRAKRAKQGGDIQMDLEIDFKDSVLGIKKQLNIYKTSACGRCRGNQAEPGTKIETCSACDGEGQVAHIQRTILGQMRTYAPCSKCRGEGKTYTTPCRECRGHGVVKQEKNLEVSIPAGIEDGQIVRLQGEGEAVSGGVAGDLYINIRVKSSREFQREGNDIISHADISISQAVLGAKIKVNTIDGEGFLKIPGGTQTGSRFRLKRKGVAGIGDQLVEVNVSIPARLSQKEKRIFQELKNIEEKGSSFWRNI